MAQNRRKHKVKARTRLPGAHASIPGSLGGVLVLAAALAFGYLYVGGRCEAFNNRIAELEKIQERLRREIVNEEYKWARLKSPENMGKLLRDHGLEMIWPSEDSVVRLHRNPPPHLYAQKPGSPEWVHD